MQITINGKKHDVSVGGGHVDYELIASLAGHPDSRELYVTYRGPRPDDVQRSGTLAPGGSITGVDGMIFNAAHTGGA